MFTIDPATLTAIGRWIIVERMPLKTASGLVTLRNDPAPNSPKHAVVLSRGGAYTEEIQDDDNKIVAGCTVLTGNGGIKLLEREDGSSVWAIGPGEIIAVVDREA